MEAKESLKDEQLNSERVKTSIKATRKGLEIDINAHDVTSMRAAVNTALKLYSVHDEVKSKCQKKTIQGIK